MSSSDELPDWGVFAGRPTPEEITLLSPAAEMAALLQRYYADLYAAHQATEVTRGEGLAMLAQQAVFVTQMAATLERYKADLAAVQLIHVYRHLRVVKDQMLDALRLAGLDMIAPLGQSFEQVADLVQIEGWRHGEQFDGEVVAEVLETIVLCQGALLRPGRVIMGAPLTAEVAKETPGSNDH
jgi:hypothetical protein